MMSWLEHRIGDYFLGLNSDAHSDESALPLASLFLLPPPLFKSLSLSLSSIRPSDDAHGRRSRRLLLFRRRSRLLSLSSASPHLRSLADAPVRRSRLLEPSSAICSRFLLEVCSLIAISPFFFKPCFVA
ncbi:hypothetical protein BHE74_00031214 [Ensete ventricosum]|nr:hypothetical protein GW17_00024253 [Ensete ventricosum]RWW61712.1 hypothetical protein BHE74_00031214 [Ensete ventricosum]